MAAVAAAHQLLVPMLPVLLAVTVAQDVYVLLIV
jgi:hypothetical protein